MKQRKAMHKADGNVSASLLARDVSGRIVCGARHSEMKERKRRNRASMAEGAKTCRARRRTHGKTRKKKVEERHMARIAGVDLPRDKRVEIGLTYIYGIGRTSSNRILAEAGVNPDTRVRDLTSEEVKKISAVIDETQVVEGDLRRDIQLNIKRLKEIGCYRGIRHRKGLPVRGQKTKTNARTCKGPKRTVANKKK